MGEQNHLHATRPFWEWFLPPQASAHAAAIDWLYWGLVAMSFVITVAIVVVMMYLAIRYRRQSENQVGEQVHESHLVELTWTIIPVFIVLGLFYWGAKVYLDHLVVPEDSIEVAVVGKQWMWKFQHPGGRREINELHVPLGRKVHVRMISQDVLHSLFIPAFRVKQDALPMYYTSLWFEATKVGKFHLHCTEYCGKDHSVMGGHVYVLPSAEYERWLVSGTGMDQAPSLAAVGAVSSLPAGGNSKGRQLFDSLACASCHVPDGKGTAPSLVNKFGSKEEFTDGTSTIVDENYIRNSILNPNAKIVKGFIPAMPSYQGRIGEDEINDLIAFIKAWRTQ